MNNKLLQNILATILMIVTLILLAFVICNYLDYSKQQKRYDEELAALEMAKKQIADLQQSIAFYEREKESFSQMLFNERDVPAFLDQISETAKQSAVNIIDMRTKHFQAVKVPEEISSSKVGSQSRKKGANQEQIDNKAQVKKILTLAAMPIDIKIEGEFTSLVDFLGKLEQNKQLLTITNVEINTTRDYPILDCKFTLKIYSLKNLAELTE